MATNHPTPKDGALHRLVARLEQFRTAHFGADAVEVRAEMKGLVTEPERGLVTRRTALRTPPAPNPQPTPRQARGSAHDPPP